MSRPIGIDLFAGAGGMSLGFEQAGFDIAACVEIDPIHCATHEFNFPRCATVAQSVIGLSGAEIRKRANIDLKTVDVVFGGAPCQGFSMIGQRALDDPRNRLVSEFVRIVSELRASYFVFENVKGLTVGRHRAFLEELIRACNEAGYDVRLPWKVLDAAHYGVPQHRERLILFGARRGLPLPQYPAPSTAEVRRGHGGGPTCRDALDDLPDAEQFPELFESDETKITWWGEPSEYALKMRTLHNDSWGFGYIRDFPRDRLTSSARTDHSEISRARFHDTEPGSVEPISRFFKLASDGRSNTLRAGTDAARGAFTSPRPIHYKFDRCVTVREMARLHGYPDWFRFHETKWHGARQIGNSVPPPLAKAIAGSVIDALGVTPVHPEETLALGTPSLLRMGMAEAAEYFGVVVPIGRRDRKSGATKRKQVDIEAERLARMRTFSG
ncbi:MAG TPA: DNA cytosine methyltransferase [Caulobacteraceae bacterium]|jgi:DNA (cytosine-5)-methyltransferase 1|nr:DNA cytosine methyltransferase [Caulobacteraceae bacterium]